MLFFTIDVGPVVKKTSFNIMDYVNCVNIQTRTHGYICVFHESIICKKDVIHEATGVYGFSTCVSSIFSGRGVKQSE